MKDWVAYLETNNKDKHETNEDNYVLYKENILNIVELNTPYVFQ